MMAARSRSLAARWRSIPRHKARDAGVAVVYQDLSLVESLSIAANLMLGREPRTRLGFLKKRQLMAEVETFLKQQGIPLDPRASVSSLPFAYRQMTEICKALMGDVRVLILDEPTSALTSDEEQILFDAIDGNRRGVGVIYVTHRLNEVFRISQRVTVFRDGSKWQLHHRRNRHEAAGRRDRRAWARGDAGAENNIRGTGAAGSDGCRRQPGAPDSVAVELSNDRLRDVDLTLLQGRDPRPGGLIGSGRTEILQTIFGLRGIETGEIAIDGEAGSCAARPRPSIAGLPWSPRTVRCRA